MVPSCIVSVSSVLLLPTDPRRVKGSFSLPTDPIPAASKHNSVKIPGDSNISQIGLHDLETLIIKQQPYNRAEELLF